MVADPLTPNAKLTKIAADRRNWTATMNQNMTLIDSLIGAYFVVQNLQGVWQNSTAYTVGQTVVDEDTSVVWQCQVAHTSASTPTTFAEDRTAHSTYWSVYSSPARARGAWVPNTSYAVNDFVVSGSQYAICIQTHISGSAFATDLAAGKWSVLVDLSAAGSQVLPVPGGAADANKITVTNASGTGYTIVNADALLTILGATTVGKAVLQAASAADARTAINAQIAGSYQAGDATLTALSGAPTATFGIGLLSLASAAALRNAAEISANIATFLATPNSANLASGVSDETGTGSLVFAQNPNLVTPNLDTPSAGILTNCTGLPPSGITGDLGNTVNEATWTPTDQSGAGLSLTTNCKYTRIGNMVFAFGSITYPATGDATASKISLPVAVPNTDAAQVSCIVSKTGLGGAVTLVLKPLKNTSTASFYATQTASDSPAQANSVLSGGTFNFCLVYPAV